MGPNDADGMANSVDPDQTATLGLSVRKLRIIMVVCKNNNYSHDLSSSHGTWSVYLL